MLDSETMSQVKKVIPFEAMLTLVELYNKRFNGRIVFDLANGRIKKSETRTIEYYDKRRV